MADIDTSFYVKYYTPDGELAEVSEDFSSFTAAKKVAREDLNNNGSYDKVVIVEREEIEIMNLTKKVTKTIKTTWL